MQYDVLIVGGGPGGIYSAYELLEKRPDLKIALFEAGHALARRHCPIDGVKVKSCVKCPTCAIMNGFGGAGAFSDGKYNITNQFGGTLHEYIGKKQALELMEYVDEINVANGGEGTHLYSTGATPIKKLCLENDLHLLDASVRHLGTDKNLVVLEHLYNRLKDKMDIYFDTPVQSVERTDGGYRVVTDKGSYDGRYCVISVGRSGSKWMEQVCRELDIATRSNRVDIGVRVELPYEVFAHLTDELYESKIVYRTEKFQDRVRTFCMNPKGAVVNENTNGIVTVNGHSYEDPAMHTENTNFALLVAKHFSEPFKDSNGYGESIARLSNMRGGGVIIQRFGDLIRGQRSTPKRIEESFVTPTLSATPGDLSLVMPKLDKNDSPKVALHIENEMRWAMKKYQELHPDKPLPHITPHVFRHTFCTNMANAGMDIKTLQYVMGHSDVGVTLNVYTHASYDRAAEQMAKIIDFKGLVAPEPQRKSG